jgi:peptide/nickel transport system ATP-binding protein
MALLEVRNLSLEISRRRGGLHEFLLLVDGISFDIDTREIAGLAGESGCGKTISSLSILRLLPPGVELRGGTITLNGIPLHSLSEKELCRIRGKEISIIFQEPRESLDPLMRIGEQIGETLELHGMAEKKEARKAALEIIEKLSLGESKKIYRAFPHQLSGGMCQRVMIAIAAICRPKLLIADEPSTALDTANEEHILALLAGINRDYGTAILFISHDLSVLRRFCKRLFIMYAGKIVEEGPAEALFSAPLHPYTRGLISAIPVRERRGSPLAAIPGKVPSIEDRLPGCAFVPRCPHVMEKCRAGFPAETDCGGGHKVHCFFAGAANV